MEWTTSSSKKKEEEEEEEQQPPVASRLYWEDKFVNAKALACSCDSRFQRTFRDSHDVIQGRKEGRKEARDTKSGHLLHVKEPAPVLTSEIRWLIDFRHPVLFSSSWKFLHATGGPVLSSMGSRHFYRDEDLPSLSRGRELALS
ncbi:hypothetical protein AXG93_4316s1120 [Marchantia polymorpha subsp. ruderalis]|uniref:Uncharacterized protein n=1 Tax=Marchantia polymorpha subsp. ruderalis TaxID=1480154 RepID=A0A176VT92_MARPO|nr:hypothetical protein AXG93_4316s1120 [Marchantia polymorpha subsp. ruderalis]